MILWVVALRPEAAPLIAARELVAAPEATPWPLYLRGREEGLVITGVGAKSAAAACGWLHGYLRPPAESGWLNVGIAGHSSGPVGRAVQAHRVVEAATGRAWYPVPLPGLRLAGDSVFTVDEPETVFGRAGAYDMEASGFLTATARWATAELVQVVKVISDSPSEPAAGLDRGRIQELIEARLQEVTAVAEALARCTTHLAGRSAAPPGYLALVERWHFTVTQQRQLRRLLERHAALSGEEADLASICGRDAREALRLLAERVEAMGVEA